MHLCELHRSLGHSHCFSRSSLLYRNTSSFTITTLNFMVAFVTGNEDRSLIQLAEDLNTKIVSFVFFIVIQSWLFWLYFPLNSLHNMTVICFMCMLKGDCRK